MADEAVTASSSNSQGHGLGTPRSLAVALVALLVLSAVLNYLDRLTLSTLGPTLKGEFGLSSFDWGWINSAFALVYIFSSVAGGAWIDRVGVRTGLLLCTLCWSLAAAGHATATGFWDLCIWRMLLALGEGPGAAAAIKGVRRLMPPRLRDTGTGLIGAGWAAGALIAPFAVGPVAVRFGWQSAFLVTGGLGIAWIPLWAALAYRKRAPFSADPVVLTAANDRRPSKLAWSSNALWATMLAVFFAVPPTVFVNTFFPIYLHDAHALTQEQINNVYWQPFLATDVGQLTGGFAAYLLLRAGWTYLSARRMVMLTGFLGATVILLVIAAPDVTWALLWLNLSRFSFQAGYTVLMAYGIESVGEDQTALMSGLMNATFAACNFVFNPLLGGLADHFGYKPVFVTVAICPLLGLLCWQVLSRRHERPSAEIFQEAPTIHPSDLAGTDI